MTKERFHLTLSPWVYNQLRLVAVHEGKRLNQLIEESICSHLGISARPPRAKRNGKEKVNGRKG